VLVDIDGTLVTGSTERRFAFWLMRRKVVGPSQWLAYVLFTLRWWPRFGLLTLKKNKAYLRGLEQGSIALLAQQFVSEEIPRLLFAPCVDRVQRHLAAGDKIVLLSGTLDIIAKALARSLGVDDAVGTQCAVEAGRYTADPPLLHPFGVAKTEIAERLSRDCEISLENTVALANSQSDLPLLEMVGTGVAVTPDSRLQKAARSRRWEVIRTECI
jgi:HAD superfamily hydrolase (TIGR01490 family)